MNQQKPKILVVEDEFFLAEVVKSRLEYYGYEVHLAENGEQACQALESTKINLILMDVIMPVMDGITATQKIKSNNKFSSIPIIILTAKARQQDKEEALQAGANDYLAKPFDMDDLMQVIKKHI